MPALDINPNFFNHDAQAGGFFPITHINPGLDIYAYLSGPGKNLLVEGIRGTGKTHILKMISFQALDIYEDKKILPVYFSIAKVSEWSETDIRLFRIQLYANIVAQTITTLEKHKATIGYEKSETKKAIDRIKEMFGIKTELDVDNTLNKIKDLNEKLTNELTYNSERILEKLKAERERGASGKFGTKTVQLSIDEIVKNLTESEIQSIGRTLAFENASQFIVEFFKQLEIILGCEYILLLLDECSETSKEAQLEIFRLLKLIRGAVTPDMQKNYLYFCASVYPPYSTAYPSKSSGASFNFEPGQDATVEYLQLDELSDEYEIFFTLLTQKRLEYIFNKPITEPIKEIFESNGAFILAAYGSNGIPRRFLEILKQAYDHLCQRASSDSEIVKISQKDVENAIQVVAANQILSSNKLTPEDFKIIEEIIKRISWRNRKVETENKEKDHRIPENVYFTVYRSQMTDFVNLLLQGCLHDKGRTRLKKYHKEEGVHGPLYMLDLAIAAYSGALDKRRVIEIFKHDLKENAKRGYEYCQDFDLSLFDYRKREPAE